MWIIKDWAGNETFPHHEFSSFDKAEEFLCNFFHDEGMDYEEWRQEYEIVQI
jgi:hypothetical protein